MNDKRVDELLALVPKAKQQEAKALIEGMMMVPVGHFKEPDCTCGANTRKEWHHIKCPRAAKEQEELAEMYRVRKAARAKTVGEAWKQVKPEAKPEKETVVVDLDELLVGEEVGK